MKESSVSPERWLTIRPYWWRSASSIVCSVSDRVPIWFGLMSTALATPSAIPLTHQELFIGDEDVISNQLHPLTDTFGQQRPSRPSLTSARPSSILTSGKLVRASWAR